ncbi:MAG TPA: bis-aminopropyl spermidine synthase family protein [Anaerolineae bacterium]|nr:bis-aminopropyl spermidine synthase family protein [Anaerolineae bacterium]
MSEYQTLRGRLPDHITQGDVKKILGAILSENAPWDWFTRARIPFPFAVRILRELQDGGYIRYEGDTTRLTVRGQALATELNAHAAPNMTCPRCAGSGMDWGALQTVYDRYVAVYQARPRNENPEFDQGAMTPESLFRRLALMIHMGDLQGARVVNLGDDDLASIAIGLTGLAERITVLEIDERIGEYIASVARKNNLPITVMHQDLTKQLPLELLGVCDTFVCDPPETEVGLLLFVEKGLALLKAGDAHAGYFGATVMEASLAKWARWQKRLLNQHEIAFTHILPPFTEYGTWPDEKPIPDIPALATLATRPWYRFAFYRLETLPTFQPAQDFEEELSKVFYFDQEGYYEVWK